MLSIVFGLALPQVANAQRKIEFGLMVGPDFTTMHRAKTDQDVSFQMQLGFVIEGHAQKAISKKFSLDFGLGYGLKRYNYIWSDAIFSSDIEPDLGIVSQSLVEQEHTLHEFHLSAILKYYFTAMDDGFFVGLGISPTMLFRSDFNSKISYGNGTSESFDYSSNTLSSQFGGQALVGMRRPIQKNLDFNLELYGNFYHVNRNAGNWWQISTGLKAGFWF